MGKWGQGRASRNCLVVSRQDSDHERGRFSSGSLQRPGIQPQDGWGWGGTLYWQEGQGLPRPPLASAHGKWSLCLVSGSGLLFCKNPGFPAPARSFPFDF